MSKNNTIHVFDCDDTLLVSNSKIYYTLPNENFERGVTSLEFAKIRYNLPEKTKLDFREFDEFKSIYIGIIKGKSIIPILKFLDSAILNGHKIAILTARGNQSAVLASIKDKILFKDISGELKKLPRKQFRKRWCWAISDEKTEKALIKLGAKGNGKKTPDKLKAFVLQKILGDKEGFNNIIFYDDDPRNIKTVQDLNDPRITTIKV
jgi:hypothetical protein